MIFSSVLIIALSFMLCMLVSFDFSILAILPAVLYLGISYIKKLYLHIIFWVSYIGVLLFNFSSLMNEFRLLLNEGISSLAKWGVLLPIQEVEADSATLAMSILFLMVAMLLTEKLVWLILIASILLPLYLKQPIHLFSFGLFVVSSLLWLQYYMHRTISKAHIVIVILICCLAIPFQSISTLPELGQQIGKWKNEIQYGANDETQLSNGNLQQLGSFEKTATPAFHIVMEQPRPMYLKNFVGVKYDNGWSTIHEELTQEMTVLHHLKQHQEFQFTQFAQATSNQDNQTISIEHVKLNKQTALIPYELASSIQGFDTKNTTWQSDKLFGTSSYTYETDAHSYNEYPTIASSIYEVNNSQYKQLEALTNYLSYQYDREIPQDVQVLLKNHFEEYEHKTYEQTIAYVQEQLKALNYSENTTATSKNFLQYLLEDSKEGYSVHYATLATLLFRYYGIPARYVEGYIVSNDDIQKANAFSEITITSDARHAWPEIYIDTIGWMPVEVTPGYAQKMPALSETTYEQLNGNTLSATAPTTPAISQVADQQLPEDLAKEASTSSSWAWLWLLLIIPILLALWWWYTRRKTNKIQRSFMHLIRSCRKQWRTTIPVHEIISKINTPEAFEAYALYNEVMYGNGHYTKEQYYKMKRLIKVIKKQLNGHYS